MSELKEHLFCECDELVREYRGQLSNEMRPYYLKSEADKVIAELKSDIADLRDDKKSTDAILDERNAAIAELKRQIEFLKTTHDSCGNCSKCAEGMGNVFDENLDKLKADYKEACDRLQTVNLIKDEQKAKADKLLSCLKCLVERHSIKDCPEKDSAIEIVKAYDI